MITNEYIFSTICFEIFRNLDYSSHERPSHNSPSNEKANAKDFLFFETKIL